jgi:hypothetical protein
MRLRHLTALLAPRQSRIRLHAYSTLSWFKLEIVLFSLLLMDANHYLKNFRTWERSAPLEHNEGAVWDINLIKTTLDKSWKELVEQKTSFWTPAYIYRVWHQKEVYPAAI